MFSERDEWQSYVSDEWYVAQSREQDANRAAKDPAMDLFDIHRAVQPKAEIGAYVASQGYSVPLLRTQTDWEQAFDDGSAMLRSELPQDYDGYSGLLSSERIAKSDLSGLIEYNPDTYYADFGKLVLQGLRNGELSGREYMHRLRGPYASWVNQYVTAKQTAEFFNKRFEIDFDQASASRWRYIDGTNVRMFGDPHVEGRYYFGVLPHEDGRNWQPIGGYVFDADNQDVPQQFRKHDVPFVGAPFIEYYESIAALPYFDNTQNPVLELVQDVDGQIHFLQYLKTNQTREFIEPFDLPEGEDILRTANTRGVTPPEGREMRLFIAPNLVTRGMQGEGIFCMLTRPRHFEVQLLSSLAGFVLHEAYVSFQDNHFNSAPLYRPKLAAGLDGARSASESLARRINEIISTADRLMFNREKVQYLDIKVTSNGREAAVESDWDMREIGYMDIVSKAKNPQS